MANAVPQDGKTEPKTTPEVDAPSSASRAEERRTLQVACSAHALHDGYTDLIYVMLPIWQSEFGLTYSELGLLRGLFAGAMAGFQIPSAMLAERISPVRILALGTALAGAGFCLAGASAGIGLLIAALFIGGLGSSTQHPLASALIARAFSGARSLRALGTYNFAGDVGKMVVPAALAFVLVLMPWRGALVLFGAIGLVAGAAILLLLPAVRPGATPGHDGSERAVAASSPHPFGFWLLWLIGVADSATRMAFLTFLPFLLTAKGAGLPAIGLALTAVFAGGAAGKLVCAHLGARIGVFATVLVTEGLTAAGILALLPLRLELCYILLPLIGVALNGTSSVLYGSVPDLVPAERRARAFSIFYTGTIGSGALAPVLYGFLGDRVGLEPTLIAVAVTALAAVPLAVVLRPMLSTPDQP